MNILESMIFGTRTIGFINSVGLDVISRTVSVTTTSIGKVIGHFSAMDQPGITEFKQALEDIDLEFRIGVLEELINEMYGLNDKPASVKKALMGVNEVLINIDIELKTIKDAFNYHQTKYFNSWRTFDCLYNIETIKKHNQILNERSNYLLKLLNIYGCNTETKPQETNRQKKTDVQMIESSVLDENLM